MYWNQEMECMPRNQLEELKLRRLKETVFRVYAFVPSYREKMDAAGIKPYDIQKLDDLKYLPFTTKQDLRDNYPFGLFAVPMSEVVRIHSSSGTTGKPTVVGYTRKDLYTWSELMARALTCAGATRHSIIQNAYGYGLFTGGLGIHYGAELIGASVIPSSGGNTKRQIMLMQDFGTTVLTCTPSYALYMYDVMTEMGVSPKNLKLKAGIFGAEPWSENMRKDIENKLEIDAYDIYGLSEVIGPGVGIECSCKNGLHIFEDHFIPEIIDPGTGEVLSPGNEGELVLTTITKEAFPIIRYRTRDLTALTYDPCPCGRTHVRMKKVLGRSDDMIIVRGVNVFPSMVESVLLSIAGVEPHYLLVVDRVGTLDELEVWVEVSERFFSDQVRKLEELGRTIQKELESALGILVKVRLVEPKSLERFEGKAKRVLDKRNL
ncbi:MAG TPA: phenylacetate--CoA ligase [Syntrophothermus lipocalidus]|uniref:Phenylacetate-coenzyme A ligase n=1 Tax=Syntrophothermus lipocalidus (strain DSM 12680 / TGB-C1) TaxID=643648 RepID=D7CLH3_SYNLT|nr:MULTISPECIES: phenylacetate--CoA ligase [Syntrophothermus]ADI01558.1 Phenylacetate--CoA ligase [Syntrophothermus lipocalidus DSM 12680]NSW83755.1 phenylacetate--CoA ligase [Syntrophothermus sp.]HHV76955.1 phenylacetate--CoA ligase [Syntrophothermus lipocalidus]HOV42586.1 phenylacetate--CoA ligase [Syntrophothermus lipocalidus]